MLMNTLRSVMFYSRDADKGGRAQGAGRCIYVDRYNSCGESYRSHSIVTKTESVSIRENKTFVRTSANPTREFFAEMVSLVRLFWPKLQISSRETR